MRYDENAQPLTTTYADYLLPTSTEVPNLELIITESDTPTNPLGVKGVGEVGVVPVTSAIASAVVDALVDFDVHVNAIPIDPVNLARLIEDGKMSSEENTSEIKSLKRISSA